MTHATPQAHQQIVDAHERIGIEYTAASDALRAEFAMRFGVVQAECGAIGHIFKFSPFIGMANKVRVCAVCGALEPDPPSDD